MNSKGRLLVTCGPASAPIDEVRRITNHSTGRLGSLLSDALARAGWEVLCLRGEGATHAGPTEKRVSSLSFLTNDDLLESWRAIPDKEDISAVFHAAALTDFTIKAIADETGRLLEERKISSGTHEVTITLQPAKKLIGELRAFFPMAKLAGWKYEVSGTRNETVSKGRRQISENQTDLCVLNGPAYGAGFGIVSAESPLVQLADATALCAWLLPWLETSS